VEEEGEIKALKGTPSGKNKGTFKVEKKKEEGALLAPMDVWNGGT